MALDLSALPDPPETYEEAVAKIEALIAEGETCQRRIVDINTEITFYQGVAKVLELRTDGG